MMETRYLIPPKLNDSNLGNKIVGYRPCRHGPPRMEIEKRNYNGKIKIIGHNYGHAGSGWTLSPAICFHLNKLLIENIEKSRGNTGIKGINVPICIVGAGVIGLFTAYDLLKKGFNNLTVIAESFEELTSHIAGGLLAPFALEIDNTNEQDLVDKFCIESCNFYLEIAQGKNSEFPSECVQRMPAYVDEAVVKILEPYVTAGVMNPLKQVNVQFNNSCLNKKQKLLFVIDNAILVQTNLMMNKLYKLLKESGKINFIKKRIECFEENIEEFDVIINCTGIGAKKICLDEKMYSMQGHLINLKEQNEADLNYIITCHGEIGKSENGQIVERALYFFPKRILPSNFTQNNNDSVEEKECFGVIGGTFVQNADENSPNSSEFDLLIQRARDFFLS